MTDPQPLYVLGIDETPEQREAINQEAKALAASMRELDIAAYAVRARERINQLEAERCDLLNENARLQPVPKSFQQIASELRDQIVGVIAMGPQHSDRLPVARDRLAGIIELLA